MHAWPHRQNSIPPPLSFEQHSRYTNWIALLHVRHTNRKQQTCHMRTPKALEESDLYFHCMINESRKETREAIWSGQPSIIILKIFFVSSSTFSPSFSSEGSIVPIKERSIKSFVASAFLLPPFFSFFALRVVKSLSQPKSLGFHSSSS